MSDALALPRVRLRFRPPTRGPFWKTLAALRCVTWGLLLIAALAILEEPTVIGFLWALLILCGERVITLTMREIASYEERTGYLIPRDANLSQLLGRPPAVLIRWALGYLACFALIVLVAIGQLLALALSAAL